MMSHMKIKTDAFPEGQAIPDEYTCNGADTRPTMVFEEVPDGTVSFVLAVEDPDAPGGTWVHWLVFNIPGDARQVGSTLPSGAVQGRTSKGTSEWHGPCPPSGTHRYFWRLYALNETLDLSAGTEFDELKVFMKPHVLAEAEYMGTYEKV